MSFTIILAAAALIALSTANPFSPRQQQQQMPSAEQPSMDQTGNLDQSLLREQQPMAGGSSFGQGFPFGGQAFPFGGQQIGGGLPAYNLGGQHIADEAKPYLAETGNVHPASGIRVNNLNGVVVNIPVAPTGTEEGALPTGTEGALPTGTEGAPPTGTEGAPPTGTEGALPTGTEEGALPTGTEEGALPTGTEEGALPTGTEEGTLPTGTEEGALPTDTEVGAQPTGIAQPTGTEMGAQPTGIEAGPGAGGAALSDTKIASPSA
ncbi:hypothetical protein BC936DRAFT_141670 [Jimgerdemannia flammicorona]|uniref:Uncharacterized protein n=1 Tax=Jimgerdemannia flammicorona TaxID=994334 RepID=A0A433A1U3_9FUNG|nr:hypothetical protein BC936DRAFT_141670 [Jimgerdemannia flammicorona]